MLKFLFMSDTIFTKLSLVYVHLFMGDTVYSPEKFKDFCEKSL